TNSISFDTAGHTAQFGGTCTAGAAPSVATADWQQSGDTIQLNVNGQICLQKTKDTYRVELQYYYLDSALGHVLVAKQDSRAITGNNGALNTSAVNLTLPRLQSDAIHHAHLQLQEQDPATGTWTDVTNVYASMNV